MLNFFSWKFIIIIIIIFFLQIQMITINVWTSDIKQNTWYWKKLI